MAPSQDSKAAGHCRHGESSQPLTIDPAGKQLGPRVSLDIRQAVQGRTVPSPPTPEVSVKHPTTGKGIDRRRAPQDETVPRKKQHRLAK